MKITKSYSEMMQYSTFDDRFHYLMLHGSVGFDTFGFNRYINQRFYKSKEWEHIRYEIIARDNGCDLGVKGRDIFRGLLIHHINPITPDDIRLGSRALLDPDNLITVSDTTHKAIHYSSSDYTIRDYVERNLHDTIPWKH